MLIVKKLHFTFYIFKLSQTCQSFLPPRVLHGFHCLMYDVYYRLKMGLWYIPWWALMVGNLRSTRNNVRPESSTCPKQDEKRRISQSCFWGSSLDHSVPNSCLHRFEAHFRVRDLALHSEVPPLADDVPPTILHTPCRKQQHLKTKTNFKNT